MMILRVFSAFVFFIVSLTVSGQYKLSGRVTFQQDSSGVTECAIYLNNGKKIAISDSKGDFSFSDLANGDYTLTAVSDDGKYSRQEVKIEGQDKEIQVVIDAYSKQLDEVTISEKETDFGFTHMNAVDNMGIYEGKKSEVILPDLLVANAASNNARQVFSRVAGLNIYEVDASGLQLGIGARGLDPNRTANFNVRQNGYDISADALGYPESYYTPPVEGIEKIQIVRGAASLQYGTQFGGLINFVMKKPVADRKIQLVARQTIGSYGFYNSFTSLGGTVGKLSYYTFFQYKKGNGWRFNSNFESYVSYSNVNYQFTKKTSLAFDFTKMAYLAKQPGGLTDGQFLFNPQQTNRDRNWFKVDWNLAALHFTHKFNTRNEFNLRGFGLVANRYSVGFRPNRVNTIDDNSERDLIKGDFQNWGLEARYLKHYSLLSMPCVLLTGVRYYHGFNHSQQGYGTKGKDADFSFIEPEKFTANDYRFPNRNVSVFAEQIFYLHEKLSLIPGVRYEYIHTKADGYYRNIAGSQDLAGNKFETKKVNELKSNERQFVLGGIGLSYKPWSQINFYTNLSQNYRSITFSDMRVSNPSAVIDPNLKDESGYSFDLGARSERTTLFSYDVNFFYLNYSNRIGEVQFYDANDRVLRKRGNIGKAVIYGLESYAETDLLKMFLPEKRNWNCVVFGNLALISSEYVKSEEKAVVGNQVEFVPKVNYKGGVRVGYRKLKASYQFMHLSDQYSDATNAITGGPSAVIGLIPAYSVMDLSLSYEFKWFKIESSINNLADQMYFTRRATGYPGPGILPSDGRTFYVTLQVKI